MGFSVSGATAILFLGMIVSFGIAYAGAFNAFEQVDDAYRDDADRALDRTNTAIEVANVSWNGSLLTVAVENTGSTTLSVNDTDLLVDNVYQETVERRAVEGNDATDLWLPGETLNFTVDNETRPDRIKVVTETGVSTTEVV